MKSIFLILSFLFVAVKSCLSQDTLVNSKQFAFSDTTLSIVYLVDTSALNNMVAVENNKNATIYISEDSIQSFVRLKLVESDYDRKNYKKILHELHRLKGGKIQDLTKFYSSNMKWIVSKQIISGKAKIYDKQNQVYLKIVYHRIERVISTGYRQFYFSKTDRRYLFSYAEWTGIIPNELMPDLE